MSLPSVLEPYSAWVLTHRNSVIVVLGLVLFAVACHALIMRWRVESLQRELSRGPERSERTPMYTPSRPSLVQQPEPEPAQPGGLPPVRGGRSYARNLGTALQKSGAPAAPPIYSPPTPQGWTPSAPPAQAGRPPAPPFNPSTGPWGPPAPAPAMAWPPMPAGVGPGAPQPAGQQAAPGFPPPPAQPWPAFPQQPSIAGPPPASPPGPTAPVGAPFGAPLPPGVPTLGSAGPAAPLAPPAGPLTPIQSPASYPGFQPPVAPTAPAPAPEGKRGKPKRRRFNLSVLEGLEKKIQSLPSSLPRSAPTAEHPAPSASPSAPPVVPPAPVGPPPLAPAVSQPMPTAFTTPARSTPAESPASTRVGPTSEGPTSKSASEQEAQPAGTVDSAEALEKPSRSKSARDRRAAMRSMMFGEEPAAVSQPARPEPPSAPAAEEHEAAPAAEVESAPDLFTQATSDAESEPTAAEPPVEEAPAEEPAFAFTPAPDDGQATEDQPPSVAGWRDETPAEAPVTPDTTETEPWTAGPGFESAGDRRGDRDYGLEPVAIEPEASSMDRSEPTPVEAGATAVESESEPEPAPLFAAAGESGESTAMADEAPPAPAEESKPAAGTMVIIEDDAAVAEYYATLFRGNGYRVEVANDGTSGVDLCVKVQPDVIMLDVMMPRQNGILVLQTLRASDETRNTPVVVLSNFSEPTLIKRALQLGALEYVIKTQVEGSALLQAVPRWMSREKAFAAA